MTLEDKISQILLTYGVSYRNKEAVDKIMVEVKKRKKR
jgi:hypothetical protein